MSRIRSVHPGLFTDEAFAQCSPLARLLWIGIWTEADDQGIFEWKPFGLRMRLLPGDKVDAEPILDELIAADMIRSFSHEGREYGAVRNFGRFQRPKKAKRVHPVPHELRTYVALTIEKEELTNDEAAPVPPQLPTGPPSTQSSSPPVPPAYPTSGEKPIQRKEEGGRREEEANLQQPSLSPAATREDFDKIEAACRTALGDSAPADPVIGPIASLVEQGITLNSIVAVLLSEAKRTRPKPIRTWFMWARIISEKIAETPKLAIPANGPDPLAPKVDLGWGDIPEANVVLQIKNPVKQWVSMNFGDMDGFRRGVAARAPHLLKFWPPSPPASDPAEPATAAAR